MIPGHKPYTLGMGVLCFDQVKRTSAEVGYRTTSRAFDKVVHSRLLLKLRHFGINIEVSGGFRGGSGGSLEPPSGTKLFQFHGEIYEESGKMLKTNPLLMDLNPLSRNPGSAPGSHTLDWIFLITSYTAGSSRRGRV